MNAEYLKELQSEIPIVTQVQLKFLEDVNLVMEEKILNDVDLHQEEEKNLQVRKEVEIIRKNLKLIINRLKGGPNAKKKFVENYPRWKKVREDGIGQFKVIAKTIQDDRFNCNVSKLVGYSTSLAGGTLCLASAILIPFTFGLTAPLSITGGSMIAAGTATALGTSVTEIVRLQTHVDSAQKILNEDKEYFQGLSSWLEHAADLEEALSEIFKIDIVKDISESVEKLVTRSMDIYEHSDRFKYIEQKLRSIMKYTSKYYKDVSSFTIAALILPLVTLFVLMYKIENRHVFDLAALTFKAFFNIVQIVDDVFDFAKVFPLLNVNINAVVGKAVFRGAIAAFGMTLDLAGIVLASIDVHKGSHSPEAQSILNTAVKMEEEAIKLQNVYENIT